MRKAANLPKANRNPPEVPLRLPTAEFFSADAASNPMSRRNRRHLRLCADESTKRRFISRANLPPDKSKDLKIIRRDKQTFVTSIEQGDLQISDKLFEAFRSFTVTDKKNGLTAENINSQIDYAKIRLREELATANYSTEAGSQVLLEVDPQVLKAVEAMAEAQKLTTKK